MTNQDTDSNPKVDQWSNGVDQADELYRLMKVRRAALDRIGEHTIRTGAPLATIEEPLVPIFMYHRYAVESTASMVAGQDYIYGMRGDQRTPTKGVSVDDQRKALDALAMTLRPAELTRAQTHPRSHSAASAGVRHPPRALPADDGRHVRSAEPGDDRRRRDDRVRAAARSRGAHGGAARRQPGAPGLEDVIDRLTTATFDAPAAAGYEAAVRRAEERVLVDRVMWLAAASPNSQVRAIASLKLSKLAARLRTAAARDRSRHRAAHADRRRHQALPRAPARSRAAHPAPRARRASGRADRRLGSGLARAAARVRRLPSVHLGVLGRTAADVGTTQGRTRSAVVSAFRRTIGRPAESRTPRLTHP